MPALKKASPKDSTATIGFESRSGQTDWGAIGALHDDATRDHALGQRARALREWKQPAVL